MDVFRSNDWIVLFNFSAIAVLIPEESMNPKAICFSEFFFGNFKIFD